MNSKTFRVVQYWSSTVQYSSILDTGRIGTGIAYSANMSTCPLVDVCIQIFYCGHVQVLEYDIQVLDYTTHSERHPCDVVQLFAFGLSPLSF